MEEIAISEFKAKCLAILKRVYRTGKSIEVTYHGKRIVEVRPSARQKNGRQWIGSMAGSVKIMGDIVGPIADESDWDALQ